jgi:hypothetical protein
VLWDPSEWGVEKKLSKKGLIERNEVAVHCVDNDGDLGVRKKAMYVSNCVNARLPLKESARAALRE